MPGCIIAADSGYGYLFLLMERRALNKPLEEQVGELLMQHDYRLAVAESCTGGLISHLITNVSGSSDYYLGGVVSYANEVKIGVLGVRSATLQLHGAVSQETVLEMAQGARRVLEADIAISVSGIAGPSGGTPEKPVGTVWIGLSSARAEIARHFLWQGERLEIKQQSAQAALLMLAEYLESSQ
jgi:PncC family amidohydrolase